MAMGDPSSAPTQGYQLDRRHQLIREIVGLTSSPALELPWRRKRRLHELGHKIAELQQLQAGVDRYAARAARRGDRRHQLMREIVGLTSSPALELPWRRKRRLHELDRKAEELRLLNAGVQPLSEA